MNRRITAALLILTPVLATAGFTVLGRVFNYPDVLDEPPGQVLARFREHQAVVSAWFAVLAVSAALLAPIAIGVGRLSRHRAMRYAVWAGVGAAVVQTIGLLRWPLLVPGFAADAGSSNPTTAAAGRDTFRTVSNLLGTGLGETGGYLLTATWTALVLVALRRLAGRWFVALGAISAAMVLGGVLSPFDLPVVDLANFVGYLLWSVWLVAFGIVVLRTSRRACVTPASAAPVFAS